MVKSDPESNCNLTSLFKILTRTYLRILFSYILFDIAGRSLFFFYYFVISSELLCPNFSQFRHFLVRNGQLLDQWNFPQQKQGVGGVGVKIVFPVSERDSVLYFFFFFRGVMSFLCKFLTCATPDSWMSLEYFFTLIILWQSSANFFNVKFGSFFNLLKNLRRISEFPLIFILFYFYSFTLILNLIHFIYLNVHSWKFFVLMELLKKKE